MLIQILGEHQGTTKQKTNLMCGEGKRVASCPVCRRRAEDGDGPSIRPLIHISGGAVKRSTWRAGHGRPENHALRRVTTLRAAHIDEPNSSLRTGSRWIERSRGQVLEEERRRCRLLCWPSSPARAEPSFELLVIPRQGSDVRSCLCRGAREQHMGGHRRQAFSGGRRGVGEARGTSRRCEILFGVAVTRIVRKGGDRHRSVGKESGRCACLE
jgi:hypothetical protein